MQEALYSPPSFAALLAISAFLVCSDVTPCNSAGQKDGAELYRRHCSLCHPDAPKLGLAGDLLESVRMPPPGMPAFSEERLSDADVQAIGEHIRPAGGNALRTESMPLTPQSAAQVPASAGTGTEQFPKAGKQAKAKRPWNRGFARSWTIRGRQNDEVVTLRQFVIAANGNNEPQVVLPGEPSDYTVTVTAFEIADRTLKLELTWGWKLNPGYWKIEAFDLRLSPDNKKMTGSHALRTSGGHTAASAVWGE